MITKSLPALKFDSQPSSLSANLSSTFPEKAMAPHSSTLTWKIPWTEEPGRLQSMGSLKVRHNWETSLSLFTFMHWRRKWQPTPGFLPGESQGQGSLVGCHLWDCTESDMTEVTWQQQQQQHGMLLLIYAFYTTTYLSHHVSVTTSQINIQQESRILSLWLRGERWSVPVI